MTRANFSVERLSTVLRTNALPLSSAIAIGHAWTLNMVMDTICNSGKARPMPSPSMIGNPVVAATAIGIVEFKPPASIQNTASALRPNTASRDLKALIASSPRGSFSSITVGAPIIQTGTTSASSSRLSTSSTGTGPCSSIACSAISLPI